MKKDAEIKELGLKIQSLQRELGKFEGRVELLEQIINTQAPEESNKYKPTISGQDEIRVGKTKFSFKF